MKKLLAVFLPLPIALSLLLLTLSTANVAHSTTAHSQPPDFGSQSSLSEDARQRAAEKMDEELLNQLRNTAETDTVAAIVRLNEQADLRATSALASRSARGAQVYQRLQAFATSHQAAVRSYLDQAMADSRVTDYRPYFIFNGLSVTARPDVIWQLAQREDVASVTADHIFHLLGEQGSRGAGETSARSPISNPSTTLRTSLQSPIFSGVEHRSHQCRRRLERLRHHRRRHCRCQH